MPYVTRYKIVGGVSIPYQVYVDTSTSAVNLGSGGFVPKTPFTSGYVNLGSGGVVPKVSTVVIEKGKPPGGEPPGGEPPGGAITPSYSSLSYSPIPLPSYSPISLPDLNVELTAEQLARILSESEMYGELGYSGALSRIDQNIIESARNMERFITDIRPEYWSRQRDVTAAAANAVSNWLQQANALGRLDTGAEGVRGEVGRVTGDIRAAGVEGVSILESELAKKIADSRRSHQDYVDDQNALKVGIQKEKGLAVALKNLELQRQAIDTERTVRQQTFQNQLSQAADLREWQALNIQWQTFQRDTQVMMEELALKTDAAASELETTRLQNEVLRRSLSGSGTTDKYANMFELPSGGYIPYSQAIDAGYIKPGQYYQQYYQSDSSLEDRYNRDLLRAAYLESKLDKGTITDAEREDLNTITAYWNL